MHHMPLTLQQPVLLNRPATVNRPSFSKSNARSVLTHTIVPVQTVAAGSCCAVSHPGGASNAWGMRVHHHACSLRKTSTADAPSCVSARQRAHAPIGRHPQMHTTCSNTPLVSALYMRPFTATTPPTNMLPVSPQTQRG